MQAAAVMRATLFTLAQLHAVGVCHLGATLFPHLRSATLFPHLRTHVPPPLCAWVARTSATPHRAPRLTLPCIWVADVKPQNLLFRHPASLSAAARITVSEPSGRTVPADLLLADFGCARALKRTAEGAWRSLPDDNGGTLAFTPPEAIEERLQGPHTDVWSAGCVVGAWVRVSRTPIPRP